jgi:hypothetical protein
MSSQSVVCVLRSGGDYGPEHVQRLRAQVVANGAAELYCLSDTPIEGVATIPLLSDWPGWWAKMELFRPDLGLGRLVYMDLDTTVTGDLTPLLEFDRLAIMRDVYRPRGLQSSVMVIPEAYRDMVWRRWSSGPETYMLTHAVGGDQVFLETLWLSVAVRIQDWLPGFLVSYKADKVAAHGTQGASLVVHHGKPRPWEVGY